MKSDQKLLEENNVSQKEAKSIETETETETSSHGQKQSLNTLISSILCVER